MVRTKYKPVLNKAGNTAESNLSVRFEGPRKKDPAAMNIPKAHAPEMPRDALCYKNTATHQHANVARGSEQTHGT